MDIASVPPCPAMSRGNEMTRPVLKTSTALGCGIAALAVFLIAWFAHQYHSFQQEREAARILRDEYGADSGHYVDISVRAVKIVSPEVDLWQLRHGRIAAPFEYVRFKGVTVDQKAWQALLTLRPSATLMIENCRIAEGVDLDFPAFPDLEQLLVTSTPLSARQIATIAGLRSLAYLRLNNVGVDDESVKSVADLPALWFLELSGDFGDAAAGQLGSLGGLRVLHLCSAKITDGAAPLIARLAELEKLDLSGTGITDESLGELSPLKSLETLYLSQTNVTDAGVAELRRLPKLTSIVLDGTRITKGSLSLLAEIPTLDRDEVSAENTVIDAAELTRWRAGETVEADPASE
jgi:hypothetical protein